MTSDTLFQLPQEPVSNVLFALHPKYAELIIAGEKTVEFRSRIPACWRDTRRNMLRKIWVYATLPVGAVLGSALVRDIYIDQPEVLWGLYHEQGKIGYDDFCGYFAGADKAFALRLTDITPIDRITLAELRVRRPGFCPPRSFTLDFDPYYGQD